jgi:filamentous hemagglutinin family protein
LFHSFSSFSVSSGETAAFLNAPSITNILSRITGGSPSDIQGTIRTQGSANLFLMNPNGILFGPGAQLNVGGSFVATTANTIRFPGGEEFSMTSPVNPQNSLLSVNPSAFLFNQIAAQPIHSIESQASLSVPADRSLLLVGGNTSPTVSSTGSILIDGGTLLAPGGRVELGGATGPGAVGLNFLDLAGNSLGLSFPTNLARADILLRNATIDVAAGGGGSITLYARNLELSGRRNPGRFSGNSLDPGDTYTLQVSTENHNLGSAGTVNETEPNDSVGTAQNIDGFFSLSSNPDVESSSTIPHTSIAGTGDGTFDYYSVTVETAGSRGIFDIDNSASGSDGIDTQLHLIDREGNLLTNNDDSLPTVGAGGSTSSRDSYVNYVFESPGTYVIRVGEFDYFTTAGSTLRAGIGSGLGSVSAQAGDIKIDATGSVTVVDSDIINAVEFGALGNGGDINITAESLSMINGALLFARTLGQGNAGSINIATSGPVSFSGLDSEGGFSLASSSVNSGAVGQGGDITIRAGSLSLDNGATLTSRTRGQGDAGNVTFEVSGLVSLTGLDSEGYPSFASSSVEPDGVGRGGDVTIRAGSLSLDNGTALLARTRGQGDARRCHG